MWRRHLSNAWWVLDNVPLEVQWVKWLRNTRSTQEFFPDSDQLEPEMRTYDPHKNTTETRQGDRKVWTARVLVIATVAVVVLFALIWWIFAMQTPPGV